MKSMTLSNVGPIAHARIEFGDLTVLVGPQATGKSIALQFLKLLLDKGQIQEQLHRHGIDWAGDQAGFLDTYFGEGMRGIWGPKSSASIDRKSHSMKSLARRTKPASDERVFMIPAQRVLALRNGWPRPFTDYAAGDPFAVRDFSEKLRNLAEREFGANEHLFPQKGRLKIEFREMLEKHIFGGFSLKVHRVASQKRLVLARGADALPNMVWSAGQREFVPMLLGLYWLMPPTKVSRRGEISWAILEEIEMGLHPRAINAVLVMVLELVARGYRVCVSTHSSQVLEAIWAIQQLQQARADERQLLTLFGCKTTQPLLTMAKQVLGKRFRAYFFDPESRRAVDISQLDPGSESALEASWGGLADFSQRAGAIVADAVASAEAGRG